MEYETVTQKGLLLTELMLENAKQLQCVRLSWHIMFENYRPLKPRQWCRITLYNLDFDQLPSCFAFSNK
jgi:hypothetical protein